MSTTPVHVKDVAALKALLSQTPAGDIAKVIAATFSSAEDRAAVIALAGQPDASPALKELVDQLIEAPLLSAPRSPTSRPIAEVIQRLNSDIVNNRRNGPTSGLVARFEDAYVSDNGKTLVLTPRGARGEVSGLESTLSTSTAGGVFTYSLQGRYAFGWAETKKISLRDLINNHEVTDKKAAFETLARYGASGKNLDFETSVIALETNDPRDPVIYLAALPRDAGTPEGFKDCRMAVICKGCKVDMIDPQTGRFIGGPGGLEKPVVYFYPVQRTSLDVTVEVRGRFTAQYPKPVEGDSTWRFIAETNGTILDPRSGRHHSYLYWEADPTTPMAIDPGEAHLIKGSDATNFLERVAAAYAFNDRETTDFVSYWVGRIERHPYCMVQLLSDSAYEGYAKMTVVPTPDTVNRLFMVIRGTAEVVPVGAPALPIKERKGFTVVEWGGAEI